MWTGSSIALTLPPGLTPGAPSSLFPGGTAQWRQRQAQQEVSNRQLEHVLNQQEVELTVANMVVVAVGVLMGLLVLTGFVRTNRSGRIDRKRILATAPDHLVDPPDSLDPALVAVLVGEAKSLDLDAVAGTMLDLAHREVIGIDAVGVDRFVVRVPEAAAGATSTETIVLDALRERAAARGGDLSGPPLWGGRQPRWWRTYRRDVFRRARAMGFIERRYRLLYFGPFAAVVPCVTAPFWAEDKIWLVPAVVIAMGFLTAIPLGGWRLSTNAYYSLARWLAFARYARDQGNLGDVGAPGVTLWGPYLSYGAVLGVARRAAADLAPTHGREGRARREISRAR
jgi:hypothetical protein